MVLALTAVSRLSPYRLFFHFDLVDTPAHLEADLKFWQEVQKYKGLCHAQTNPRLVQHKMRAMIACFFASEIPPTVSIGVPREMAELISQKGKCVEGACFFLALPLMLFTSAARVSRSQHCSPYVFRLAESHVFNHLFRYFPAFSLFQLHRKKRLGGGRIGSPTKPV